jgi:hypothetical protein
MMTAMFAMLAAGSAGARPCATMATRELLRRGNPTLGVALGERRVDEVNAFVDSAALPLRVHYGDDSTPERAAQLLGFLEDAWALQVDGAGFDAPLPDQARGGDDRFDAYLVSLSPGVGARTFAEPDASDSDGRRASPAFLEMSPVVDDDALEVFAHHEFQHALQFAIERDEAVGFLESTAVWFELLARPDLTLWQDALPAFQFFPQASAFSTGADIDALMPISDARFEYGAGLLALYLDDVHGDGQGSLFSALLRASAQADDVADNEPDWLDALPEQAGVSAADVVSDFIGWRALVGALAVPGDGPSLPVPNAALLRVGAVVLESLDGRVSTTDDVEQGPTQYGCVVRAIQASAQEGLRVRASADAAAERTLALSTLITVPGSGSAVRAEPSARGAHVEAELDVPASALLHVAFCDVTDEDVDAPLAHHPISFSLLRTDVQWPDAGPEPELDAGPDDKPPPPDPTCLCANADARAPLATGALVVLVSRLRRRRALRRQSQPADTPMKPSANA